MENVSTRARFVVVVVSGGQRPHLGLGDVADHDELIALLERRDRGAVGKHGPLERCFRQTEPFGGNALEHAVPVGGRFEAGAFRARGSSCRGRAAADADERQSSCRRAGT